MSVLSGVDMVLTCPLYQSLVTTPRPPGALDGGGATYVACLFKEMVMLHVSVAQYRPLSNLRNTCTNATTFLLVNVAVAKAYVALSNLRNGQVTLSISGVEGHPSPIPQWSVAGLGVN